MAGDDEGGVCGIGSGGDFFGPLHDEAGHGGVDADGEAVVEGFPISLGGWSV